MPQRGSTHSLFPVERSSFICEMRGLDYPRSRPLLDLIYQDVKTTPGHADGLWERAGPRGSLSQGVLLRSILLVFYCRATKIA